MNIFYLHRDPNVSAQAMTNKHIVKMVLETAQILSTAHHTLDEELAIDKDRLYKPTHKNHPSCVWVRASNENYEWLYSHFLALAIEYANRYGKLHKSYLQLFETLHNLPHNIPRGEFTQPPQAMPDIYKDYDSVQAYRRYYLNEKIKNDDDLTRYVDVLSKNKENKNVVSFQLQW